MKRKSKDCLVIFIKNPKLGNVKTRIAATLGDQKALDIYLNLLDTTIKSTTHEEYETVLFLSENVHDLNQYPFERKLQVVGGLGDKLKSAFDEVLTTMDKCLIIGSDCPYLNSDIILEAFQSLNEHDVVLGPTPDGGYYLIGLKQNENSLFEDITWSTESVMAQTILAAKNANLSTYFLPILTDVDHASDWDDYLFWKKNQAKEA
ncbi:MAG TPA: TIGR04282 family arsenosugar biosynthesis glycosyltransferase [Saprospiraceae bacterium]|nr:TIGR04282 family arsenosugar biosynthesis glycosyltransferase [Saprospiraceae bacterium]HPN71463.1 TIGR04282 family arsenosugar biosynthesis glycosyltransferase [Saprospiraceae bacterium]